VERFMVGHANIQDIPDRRLSALLGRVKESLRERIGPDFRLILFGSQARREAGPYSDVDLLVVLPDRLHTVEMRDRIRDRVYDFSLEGDFLLSVLIVPESVYRERRGWGAFAAVEREGVPI